MPNRQVVSISLPEPTLKILNELVKRERKSRSQVVKELINRYETEVMWDEILKLGQKTAEKFNIKSEADVLKIING
ncbi:ribbon-helix-helix protein, CopG family [Patescibacteria group bacterium]|nr:ribbon-helix-helix protein, CopG family [Patescibacteria group bacterium]